MSRIKDTITFVLLLFFVFNTSNLHAQSKTAQGAAIIGVGKIIKNSKPMKDTIEFTKATTFGIQITDNKSNKAKQNNNNNQNNENQDFLTSSLLGAKDSLIKSNKKTIDSLEKSAKGIKEAGENIGNLFSKVGDTFSGGADPNNDDDNNFTKVSGDKVEAKLETTEHGTERIAGDSATRGGVLSTDEIITTKSVGQVFKQADGANVYLHEVSPGKFNAVVQGEKGIITTMKDWSQNSINRIAKNYGWKIK